MADLWYKNAIVYSLDVETFMDSDGDGIGDFRGLTSQLDYLAGLGATCLWLLPFFPSPNRDNGYDVTNHYGVDERLGTLGDFVEFSHEAHERGMRLIIDLVVNHTSDQHPWFQAARADKGSKYRDYYVWSEEKPKDAHTGMVFPGVQERTWTYDKQAKAYYNHRFYHHQPDLNIANPEVRAEVKRIMGFWLELGVSGFRIDAAPFMIELTDSSGRTEAPVEYAYLEEFRDFLSWRRGDAILLAEANVGMDTIKHYFGDGHRMHMLFNFYVNQHLYLALVQRVAAPLTDAFQQLPPLPSFGQWAHFLRNHDELDLGRLSEEDRQAVFAEFAPDKDMRLYERGIRRRLATMLGGDTRRLKLAYSLMFSLPGTPVLWYGEEISMGDDLSLPERNSVRTPMQWSDEPNGGFSSAPPEKLIRPVISEGPYAYQRRNVAVQQRDRESLLNWLERVIRVRRECPEFGFGCWQVLPMSHPGVFAHCCQWRGGLVLALHNFAREACTVDLNLSEYQADHLIDMLGDREYRPLENGARTVDIDGYGFRWFRVGRRPVG